MRLMQKPSIAVLHTYSTTLYVTFPVFCPYLHNKYKYVCMDKTSLTRIRTTS
jgi:hypothetical protein